MELAMAEAKMLFGLLAGVFDVTCPFEVIVDSYTKVLYSITWGNPMIINFYAHWNSASRASYCKLLGLRVVCCEAVRLHPGVYFIDVSL